MLKEKMISAMAAYPVLVKQFINQKNAFN